MRRLLAGLALAVLTGQVAACINDSELPAHEREFRSRYRGPASPPPAPSVDPTSPPGYHLLVGGGVALLATAVALAAAGGRQRR